MKIRLLSLVLAILTPVIIMSVGCSGGGDSGSSTTEHNIDKGGTMHAAGSDNPLVNCVSCHGTALRGGTGTSCYSCHTTSDHTLNRRGTMHRSEASSTCVACHGPSNSGGLGSACSTCH